MMRVNDVRSEPRDSGSDSARDGKRQGELASAESLNRGEPDDVGLPSAGSAKLRGDDENAMPEAAIDRSETFDAASDAADVRREGIREDQDVHRGGTTMEVS